ncbi:hypothetical protein EY04_27615 [Pseudomonas chlororaphis]|uniref:hypothetical protein n=1 Tax=Pseudomonas chlororaphis TaxID=587753 RepID=UPI0004AC0C05|nr:hypothetical protein EY04_27615 [Pseudomonas chlororaphis]
MSRPPYFRELPQVPDYSAIREGSALQHNGFRLDNSWLNTFIHARREKAQCTKATHPLWHYLRLKV